MRAIFKYLILATFTATLVGAASVLPRIYAQSSVISQTGCPSGKPVGLQCVTKFGTYSLPTGRWTITVEGSSGNLTIKSVDKLGRIVGKLAGGDLCPTPCDLKNASFNDKTGRIGFTIHSTLICSAPACSFVAPSQEYNGTELKPKIGLDTISYEIDGIGKMITPSIGPGFNWTATKTCLVMGCIG